jgi:hypothetical protein
LLFALGLAFSGNALAQSPDFQSFVHVFPQFVDGLSAENRSYVSTLQISATDFYFPTRCSLGLLSIPPTTMTDVRGVRETNTLFNFILAPSGWQILQSQGRRRACDRAAPSCNAIVQCLHT